MNELDKLVYNKIARKNLTTWCIIRHRYNWEDEFESVIDLWTYVEYDNEWKDIVLKTQLLRTFDSWNERRFEIINEKFYYSIPVQNWYVCVDVDKDDFEVIGHPVLLSDVLNYIAKLDESFNDWKWVMIPHNFPNMKNQSRYWQLSDNWRLIVDLFSLWDMSEPEYENQSERLKNYIRWYLINNQ